ncbi:acyl-CoA thioesterase [bacterium]|nr:acyl-CoA thioesterase [bacterium]
MKHTFEERVFYADTDPWGMVWHGAYIKWLEKGRIYWCELNGHTLKEFEEQDILMPVINLNIRYKRSAKLNDVLVIETDFKSTNGTTAIFEQKITDKTTGKVCITAEVEIITISASTGKMFRTMPDTLNDLFKQEMLCQK